MRYIGSKSALLGEIRKFVSEIATNSETFCDIFAGTGAVGQEFKSTHQVFSNDLLYFCAVINQARIELSRVPRFRDIRKFLGTDPVEFLNNLTFDVNDANNLDFIFHEYSPMGKSTRQYLSSENALKIDRIRQLLNEWKSEGLLSIGEYTYLLSCLIESVPSVSNIAGTYGAYLKSWDRRALKSIEIEHLQVTPNASHHRNRVFNETAESLVRKISGDVLYMDPPYNARQYSSNYHVLETIARYDYPILTGKTGTRAESSGSSDFCKRGKVLESFTTVLEKAQFRQIVVSYSSEGLLAEEELIEAMRAVGQPSSLVVKKIPYRRYSRISDSNKPVLHEFLIGINKQ